MDTNEKRPTSTGGSTRPTKVYIVWTEYNRGSDLDGGADINGAYRTARAAQDAARAERRAHKADGRQVYGHCGDAEWDVDIHIDTEEVRS